MKRDEKWDEDEMLSTEEEEEEKKIYKKKEKKQGMIKRIWETIKNQQLEKDREKEFE